MTLPHKDLHLTTLGGSILLLGGFHVCSWVALNDLKVKGNAPNMTLALRWASKVALLGAFYKLLFMGIAKCFGVKKICRRSSQGVRSGVTIYRDLPDYPPTLPPGVAMSEEEEEPTDSERNASTASAVALPPEMSFQNIWLYAYGLGVVCFVGIYSLSGAYMPGGNWWSLGVLVIAVDELLSMKVGKTWVCLITVFSVFSTISVWWGILGKSAVEQSLSEILMGVLLPAVTPFFLFEFKFNSRVLQFQGIAGLINMGLPMVVIIASQILLVQDLTTTTESHAATRRHLTNGSSPLLEFKDTHATFNSTGADAFGGTLLDPFVILNHASSAMVNVTHGIELASGYSLGKLTALLLAPFFWGASLSCVINCVMDKCTSELAVALTLCSAVRFCLSREYDAISVMAITPSCLSFVLLLLLRRSS